MSDVNAEPDALDFTAYGLACAMRRGPGGHWCGYVGIPEDHPWFGKSYSDMVKVPKSVIERPIDIDKVGAINMFSASLRNNEETLAAGLMEMVLAIDVHGGLTWAEDCPGGGSPGNGLWWLGFDCAHAGDNCPNYNGRGVYRDAAFVRVECEGLAQQLAALASAKGET